MLEKVKDYVGKFIADKFPENIIYHNLDHTLDVVDAAEFIGRESRIAPEDLEKVLIAAWFHDTGYYLGRENHEQASVDIASKFLKAAGVEDTIIDTVKDCILATKIPQSPKNNLERILCDADLYHLSTDDFMEKTELLWKEYATNNPDLLLENWLNVSRDFVSKHTYHTDYGKQVLQPAMEENLKLLDKKISALRKG